MNYQNITKTDFIQKFRVEKLNENHVLTNFSSGRPMLDKYLKEEALIHQENNFNVNYLIYQNDYVDLVAFFTLSSDLIKLKNVPENITHYYDDAPSIKLGKFAINQQFQKIGLGTMLLDEISFDIKKISEKIGVKYITVDAYCDVRNFYKKNDFKYFQIHNLKKLIRKSKRNPNTTVPMYKDIRFI